MSEHAKAAARSDTHPAELKYRDMGVGGGAAARYFKPVVGGAAVPKLQLAALEGVEIGSRQNSWNDAGKNSRQH